MTLFEYKVTRHPASEFQEVIYFCSQEGTCSLEVIPTDQIEKIEGILNEGGQHGWELVQATFGKDGVLVFWKRMLQGEEVPM
jgi:hypothetical protein